MPACRRMAFRRRLILGLPPRPAQTFFVNREKARYVDLYRERKERRKNVDREVALLMEHGGEKVRMRTTASNFRPVKTWLQRPATAVVDGWETQVRAGGKGGAGAGC